MILSLLPNYQKQDVKVKGFIFSRPANKKFLRDLYRESMDKRKQKACGEDLVLALCYNKSGLQNVTIKFSQLPKLQGIPLGDNALFDKLELYHIDVAEPNDSITMDTSKFV